jgi:hypothetical protein
MCLFFSFHDASPLPPAEEGGLGGMEDYRPTTSPGSIHQVISHAHKNIQNKHILFYIFWKKETGREKSFTTVFKNRINLLVHKINAASS